MLRDKLKTQKHSMFPHTVTIYNVIFKKDDRLHETITNHITVLKGVLLDASKAVNVNESGLAGADAVNLYIPFGVKAVDGVTGEPKTYVGPMEWTYFADNGVPEDLENIWTMTLDGQGTGDSFFIKGEVVEPDMALDALSQKYDGVYNITKVDEKDFGDLQHWEVGGA